MKNTIFNLFKKSLWVLLISISFMLQVQAQSSFKINGTVFEGESEPLIGATVSEVGTNQGVLSSEDGSFELSVSKSDATIKVSFIGFNEQVIPLNGRSKIAVYMQANESTLNEVVVVGYNLVKKKDLTGAVSQIDAEKLVTQ